MLQVATIKAKDSPLHHHFNIWNEIVNCRNTHFSWCHIYINIEWSILRNFDSQLVDNTHTKCDQQIQVCCGTEFCSRKYAWICVPFSALRPKPLVKWSSAPGRVPWEDYDFSWHILALRTNCGWWKLANVRCPESHGCLDVQGVEKQPDCTSSNFSYSF